jgi:hypothetical protein
VAIPGYPLLFGGAGEAYIYGVDMTLHSDVWDKTVAYDPTAIKSILAEADAWRLDERGYSSAREVTLSLDRQGTLRFKGTMYTKTGGGHTFVFQYPKGLPAEFLYVEDNGFFKRFLLSELRPGIRKDDTKSGLWVAYSWE